MRPQLPPQRRLGVQQQVRRVRTGAASPREHPDLHRQLTDDQAEHVVSQIRQPGGQRPSPLAEQVQQHQDRVRVVMAVRRRQAHQGAEQLVGPDRVAARTQQRRQLRQAGHAGQCRLEPSPTAQCAGPVGPVDQVGPTTDCAVVTEHELSSTPGVSP